VDAGSAQRGAAKKRFACERDHRQHGEEEDTRFQAANVQRSTPNVEFKSRRQRSAVRRARTLRREVVSFLRIDLGKPATRLWGKPREQRSPKIKIQTLVSWRKLFCRRRRRRRDSRNRMCRFGSQSIFRRR